jgi:hypothetical protein
MEETIDPGTGLPVGAQPTPVGAYDFTSGLQSMQNTLDKIAQGQANRSIQQRKDKKAFEELTITKPTVWKQDDEYINEALKLYEEALKKASAGGVYDQEKWSDADKKAIRDAEAELERRAAEAKANEKYYNESHEKVRLGDNKTYDTGWFNTWGDEYLADSSTKGSQERIRRRLSADEEDSPYQKPYTIDDVVQKYKVFHRDEKGATYPDVEDIYRRILAGTTSGIGKRMYELNRETDQETPEQFARRVADLSPGLLMDSEALLKSKKQAENDYGFNIQGFKWDEDHLTNDVNAAENVNVNTLYAVRKGMSDLTVTVGAGNLQWTYKIAYITRSNNGMGGYDYWIHGERNGVPLSTPQKMDQQDIGAVNAKTQLDLIATFEQKELAGAKKKWKSNEASNLPAAIGEPKLTDITGEGK